MNFKDIETVKFELMETITCGVERNIRNGYSIPVSVSDNEVKTKIENLAKEHNAKSPLYGNGEKKTLYLKSKCLSEKQKKELLNKGLTHIRVELETKCVFTNNDETNHLCFKVNKTPAKAFTPPAKRKWAQGQAGL